MNQSCCSAYDNQMNEDCRCREQANRWRNGRSWIRASSEYIYIIIHITNDRHNNHILTKRYRTTNLQQKLLFRRRSERRNIRESSEPMYWMNDFSQMRRNHASIHRSTCCRLRKTSRFNHWWIYKIKFIVLYSQHIRKWKHDKSPQRTSIEKNTTTYSNTMRMLWVSEAE